MRTTLTIDDDILAAAKDLADSQQKTVGAVLSSLARKGLMPAMPVPDTRNGIPQLPIQPGAGISTPELIRQLMDELS
jgi:hypothetical protein